MEQSGIGVCVVSVPAVRHAELAVLSGPGGFTHEVGADTLEFSKVSAMTGVPVAPAGAPTDTAARVAVTGVSASAPTNSTRLT